VIVASVGVLGTLASAVITQVLAQRAESRRSDREEQGRIRDQQASEDQRKIDQLRNCYVQLNANDRHYRDVMLAYA
jgi:type II secretory pathway pseudopilin PulG